jgi:hypothetical protein
MSTAASVSPAAVGAAASNEADPIAAAKGPRAQKRGKFALGCQSIEHASDFLVRKFLVQPGNKIADCPINASEAAKPYRLGKGG